jgi:nicotinamidase-related amidase
MSTATPDTSHADLVETSAPFLAWLSKWQASLPTLDLQQYLSDNEISPHDVAVISADLVEGFCYTGPLSSPRIADIVGPSAALFRRAHHLGIRQFCLVQEYHTHDAPEFEQFGPHCIRGTEEAHTVKALLDLPFAETFQVIHKNSLHPALHTTLDEWLSERPNVATFITVGDCTDLCLYQLVMHLKLNANAAGYRTNVLVPADCVQTYDMPIEVAEGLGAMPHDGDLMHAIFLYHMALNGALVVRSIV